ncbi:class I SAM-dependent methyltransferase [Phyllobacterium sophorae]|uniref:Methyltransferase n=1 Tax=Phyllobacterium sophorae TaxID=1520277 RepID=A0A2P7B566_9HYPH|nr:class I SAM-dependent methyltransferase [Phyllobacterium sophorae]PSH61589.1 methyltransferase [Phyllobacterium sophorae]
MRTQPVSTGRVLGLRWPDPRDVVQSPGVIPEMSVLDLCCGDGYFTAPLAKLVGNVYALDLDPLMIELAKAEVARLHTSVLKWICADARDAPQHITESVDYVLMANTFHGVPDQSGLMEAIRAMIRPNGLFGVVNWHALPRELTIVLNQPRGSKSDLRMSPEALQAVVEPTGFQTIRVQELPPYHYAAIFGGLD